MESWLNNGSQELVPKKPSLTMVNAATCSEMIHKTGRNRTPLRIWYGRVSGGARISNLFQKFKTIYSPAATLPSTSEQL